VFPKRNLEARGHDVSLLLGNLPEIIAVPEDIIEAGKSLDKLYIPTRYPNGLEQRAPTEFYTRREAEEAIGFGERILDFCACSLS